MKSKYNLLQVNRMQSPFINNCRMIQYPQSIQPLFFAQNQPYNMQLSRQPEKLQSNKIVGSYVIDFSREVGHGNFSRVYFSYDQRHPNVKLTAKVVNVEKLRLRNLENLIKCEVEILQSIKHDNILCCKDVLWDATFCYIFTQFCQGGCLQSKIRKSQKLTQKQIFQKSQPTLPSFSQKDMIPLIRDIFQAMLYMQKSNIIHRDIKSTNIFLKDGHAIVADFGFAKFCKQPFYDMSIGSLPFMPPQALVRCLYSNKTDVWAMGILIYEIFHGESPFARSRDQKQLIQNTNIPFNINSIRKDLSMEMKQLILVCLEIDMEKRMKFSEIVQCRFYCKLFGITMNGGDNSKIYFQSLERKMGNIAINTGNFLGIPLNNMGNQQLITTPMNVCINGRVITDRNNLTNSISITPPQYANNNLGQQKINGYNTVKNQSKGGENCYIVKSQEKTQQYQRKNNSRLMTQLDNKAKTENRESGIANQHGKQLFLTQQFTISPIKTPNIVINSSQKQGGSRLIVPVQQQLLQLPQKQQPTLQSTNNQTNQIKRENSESKQHQSKLSTYTKSSQQQTLPQSNSYSQQQTFMQPQQIQNLQITPQSRPQQQFISQPKPIQKIMSIPQPQTQPLQPANLTFKDILLKIQQIRNYYKLSITLKDSSFRLSQLKNTILFKCIKQINRVNKLIEQNKIHLSPYNKEKSSKNKANCSDSQTGYHNRKVKIMSIISDYCIEFQNQVKRRGIKMEQYENQQPRISEEVFSTKGSEVSTTSVNINIEVNQESLRGERMFQDIGGLVMKEVEYCGDELYREKIKDILNEIIRVEKQGILGGDILQAKLKNAKNISTISTNTNVTQSNMMISSQNPPFTGLFNTSSQSNLTYTPYNSINSLIMTPHSTKFEKNNKPLSTQREEDKQYNSQQKWKINNKF